MDYLDLDRHQLHEASRQLLQVYSVSLDTILKIRALFLEDTDRSNF